MKINTNDWEFFNIQRKENQSGLFDIENCKCGTAGDLDDGTDINYIGAKKNNNGVMRSVAIDYNLVSKGHGIMFICDGQGSVGYTNYMDKDFIGSTTTSIGYDQALNKYNAMFLVAVLDMERFKYSYGRKYRAHIGETQIRLPIKRQVDGTPFIDKSHRYSKKGYVPDWEFMESYIKSLRSTPITTKNKPNPQLIFNVKEWKKFTFGQLITDIYKATAINKDDLLSTDNKINGIRYITRTADDNGCELLADKNSFDNSIIEKGNAITIGDTTATCFYQEEDFITGDHMVVIRADSWMNPYTALFIVSLLNKEQYRYSYGRAFLIERIKETVLKLPVSKNGEPDWLFMEKFIHSLPYGDRLETKE